MSFLSEKALRKGRSARRREHIGIDDIPEKAIKERTQFDDSPTFNTKVVRILKFVVEKPCDQKAPPLQVEGYRRGANAIKRHSANLERFTKEQLLQIGGFGDGLARVVLEVARTGSCRLYKRCTRPTKADPDDF